MRAIAVAAAVAMAGCTSILGITDPVAAAVDAHDADASSDVPLDGSDVDAPSDGPTVGSPLLLSEVVLTPTGAEMIEVVNTAAQPVDLSSFHLSDSGQYWRLPGGVPTIDDADFIARFPSGSSIPGHGVVTVALGSATAFEATYGIPPTFSIADATMTIVAEQGVANLTNGGEVVVLSFWDGESDLVADADIVLAGSPSAGNSLIDKSGVLIDGPDADDAPTAYAIDARTIGIQMGTPGSGESTKRIALEGDHEQHAGGNGLDGDDETSEDTGATWDSITFGTPTPGAVPPALLQ
jgi:hypothetical protein